MDAQTRGTARLIEAPPPGGVRVWLFRATEEAAGRARGVLCDEELADIDRLARERDRHAGALSRAVWREAAASAMGIEAAAVQVGRTGYGRPYPIGLERTATDLSTSHSGDVVGLAVGTGVRVGVDIETTIGVQVDDHINLAVESVSGPALELVQDRTERTLLAWCVLEALLKADGRGMHLEPSMVSTEIRALWGWNSARVAGTAWWVRRFETPRGTMGAVAAGAPVIDLECFGLGEG